jgi:hypothetical protein
LFTQWRIDFGQETVFSIVRTFVHLVCFAGDILGTGTMQLPANHANERE